MAFKGIHCSNENRLKLNALKKDLNLKNIGKVILTLLGNVQSEVQEIGNPADHTIIYVDGRVDKQLSDRCLEENLSRNKMITKLLAAYKAPL